MKAKKIRAILAVAVMGIFMSGCNNSVQTEEEIVVPKQEEETEGTEPSGEQGDGAQAGSGEAGVIAEQVQAPENYTWEGSSENISVKVDAPVIVPQGEGFKSYRVTARTYTQEDYDHVSQTLLKGAGLWNRDYDQMEKSNGFTKSEIEERIERIEKNKEAGGEYYEGDVKRRDYDTLIREWEAMKEEAPDEAIITDVPALVPSNVEEGTAQSSFLNGYATVDGKNYGVMVDNNLTDEWRWINFEVSAERANASFSPAGEEDKIDTDKFEREALKQDAEKLVADMGFSDFAPAGDEYFQTFSWNEETNAMSENNRQGYGVHFTRALEGIPITYTYSDGTAIEDGVVTSWPYETLDLIYDEEGLAKFKWSNPYEVEKLSEETLFLLPFSEIQTIFEEMFLKKYEDLFIKTDAQVSFEIHEVRLGYMRVMEKGNFMEGTMVPVWDFFGSETLHYDEAGEEYTYGGPFSSWLTINALDGTIINRDFGY